MTNRLLLCTCAALLAGCATYQPMPLPANHPANPNASEAVTPPAHRLLTMDATTRATRERFAATEGAQESQPTMQQHETHGMETMSGMHHGAADADSEQSRAKVIYTCKMHPQVQQDHPGHCPICGMTLVKKKQQPETQHDSY